MKAVVKSTIAEMIVEYNDEQFIINVETIADNKVRIEIKPHTDGDVQPYHDIEIYDEVEHVENFSSVTERAVQRLVELSETYAE